MKEFERKPDGGLSAWIETYEAIGGGENDAEMLCLLLELRRRRENQAEAERERDELRGKYQEVSGWYAKMKTRMLSAEAELARRDAAASEPAVLLQSDIDRIVPAIDPNGLDEARHYIEHALYVDRERIRSELKELGAQPAVLPYLSDDTLREMVSAYNIANHSSEAYEEMRAAMDRGAQQQPQKVVVVVLPAPERHREPGIIVGMYESFVVYKALDEAGVKWEVKK